MQQRIEEPNIVVLEAVNFMPLLGSAHAQVRFDFNIIIHPVDIRIGMVNDIVFHAPENVTHAREVCRGSCKFIHDFAVAETSVTSIVHDIKTNGGGDATQHHTFQHRDPGCRGKKYQVYIQGYVQTEKQASLKVQTEIAGLGLIVFFEILLHSPFQLLVKVIGVLQEFRCSHP